MTGVGQDDRDRDGGDDQGAVLHETRRPAQRLLELFHWDVQVLAEVMDCVNFS